MHVSRRNGQAWNTRRARLRMIGRIAKILLIELHARNKLR
jgi:hypothetical protein